jgi:hypothetical protein
MRAWSSAPLAIAFLLAGRAVAGPPYVTDDPVPTDRGRWEVYTFVSATRAAGATEGAAGLDVNYGAGENLQLTVVAPLGFERGTGTRLGLDDLEVATKYRFIRQSAAGGMPDVAFFPKVSVPTGDHGFGEGRATLFLPLWAQKDVGPWSIFGGGGRQLRRGRDTWLAGLAVTRAAGERLSIGGEVFHETAEERGGRPYTAANVGVAYRVSERWSVLASAGPGLRNRREGRFNAYVSLKADY